MEHDHPLDSSPARPPSAFERAPANAETRSLHQCETCGQVYDLRNLGLVLHHLERGHAPRPHA